MQALKSRPDLTSSGSNLYQYRGRIVDVHDGDTVTVILELGFDISVRQKLRLHGINAPELATPAGKVARAYVLDWLKTYAPSVAPAVVVIPSGALLIQTFKDRQEKYGRYLAEVEQLLPDGTPGHNLNSDLLGSGNAVAYLTDR